MLLVSRYVNIFLFKDTATTEIYTLSLHDALPISGCSSGTVRSMKRSPRNGRSGPSGCTGGIPSHVRARTWLDRKSTRLNSSHGYISYAVFCLKKKKKKILTNATNRRYRNQVISLE